MKSALSITGGRIAVACLALLGLTAPAGAQTLGIYADSLGLECRLDARYPGGTVTAYVVGGFDDPVEVISVSFQILGVPAGWLASATPASGVTMIGEPFGDGVAALLGCVPVVFPHVIATVHLTPTSEVVNAPLVLAPNPWDPQSCSWEQACSEPCPHFCECGPFEGPCDCPSTSTLVLNGSCTTGVAEAAWGVMKRMYR